MSLQVVGNGFFASFWSLRLEKQKLVYFGRAILIWIVVVAGHCENSPRLIISKDEGINRHRFNKLQSNIVFFHLNGSPTLYVGGTDMVCSIDFDANKYMESHCENVITVLHEYQDSLLVCGTNAFKPRCWNLNRNESKVTPAQCSGIGISPFCSTQNSLSLFVEGNIYAAAPLYWQGNSLQFRRISDAKVWMYEKWLDEPTFVSATWVSRKQDPENDKIYMFFREKNPDRSADADPWISRIAQVCKYFLNVVQLICSSCSRNSTAVCIYSMDDIDRVFQESDFKGFSGNVPHPRPGTCVPDSRSLPDETINVVRTHPEMEKWVYPLHNEAAILISNRNYTKILVDQVKGAHKNTHNVMALATEDGWIHKVLEEDNRPFIISEIRLFNHTAHIHTMTLDHITKRLYVGYAEQIVGLDLQRCQDYDQTCEECVLARDPYCAWNRSHCVPVNLYNSLQNVEDGNTSVCSEQPKGRVYRKEKECFLWLLIELIREATELVMTKPTDEGEHIQKPSREHCLQIHPSWIPEQSSCGVRRTASNLAYIRTQHLDKVSSNATLIAVYISTYGSVFHCSSIESLPLPGSELVWRTTAATNGFPHSISLI
ncbi:UNVERIFIED_CONTAM: hypothetical protein FKN15_041706 [Acipenser sinensis]